jgi:hypothetical protein
MRLGFAARRSTRVSWRRAFDLRRNLTEERRSRARRSSNRTPGAERILQAIVLAYFVLTRMFLHPSRPVEPAVVGALRGFCVTGGVIALVPNR